jgi:hypothetical protein
MASADEYASWIVANQAKKGTPEFDTVAKAYQEAKSAPSEPQGKYNAATMQAIENLHKGGFGSGIPKLAYNIGGNVTDMASHFLPPGGAAAIGTAANVATETIPSLIGGGIASKAEPLMQGAGRYLMQSAIRPLVADLQRGKVPGAVETMLEQGYSPTNSGVAAMRNKAGDYMRQVDDIIAGSNKVIPVAPAREKALALAQELRSGTQGPAKMQDVQGVVKELENHPAVDDAGLISAQDAQAMKQANYKDIGPSGYGLEVKAQTNRDTLKAITRALREGIEEAHPEVSDLNAKAGELINAAKVAQRRAMIEGNKDILPIGAGVASALHNPVAALGLWANSSAAAKAALARALYSGSRAIPRAVGNTAGLVGGAMTGRSPEQ